MYDSEYENWRDTDTNDPEFIWNHMTKHQRKVYMRRWNRYQSKNLKNTRSNREAKKRAMRYTKKELYRLL